MGSISDGLSELPRELRPCCPDAGAWSCHGQAPGMCGCWECRRMEREWRRFFLREVRKFIAAAPMTASDKRAVRQKLARALRILRGWARAAERERDAAKSDAQVAWESHGREKAAREGWVKAYRDTLERAELAEATVAGQAADLSRLMAELVAAQNARDDALMQASVAAERAHQAERARDEALDAASDAAGERDALRLELAEVREELESLRYLGRVVMPDEDPPEPTEPAVCFCGKGVAGTCPCERGER